MKILLLSMPDSSEHTPTVAVRMPNGALAALAGNIDGHHQVAIADLVLVQTAVRATVERLVRAHDPDLVGLSVMTFQRVTARRIISLIRAMKPNVRIVVGGYDPSLAPEAWLHPALGVDVIVRGEGEITFRELLRTLETGGPLSTVAGLWFRDDAGFHMNPPRPVATLDGGGSASGGTSAPRAGIRPPNRAPRVLSGYTMLGRTADVVETSRGCTFDCSFCSIIEMRGRNFHRFAIDRVIADIGDARRRGARAIFLVDDNITIDAPRFATLCRAIVDAGYQDVDYLVQAMTSAIAADGPTLVPLMKAAGIRYVFLGIENVLADDLVFLKASAKNRRRRGDGGSAIVTAVDLLHRHGLFVVGGLIVGNPDDTREAIEANLAFGRRYVDWPYIQHPTPYPATPMTHDLVARGLVEHDRVDEYDGTNAVVRNAHLPAREIEFMRWKAERWMKVRHMRAAFLHDPAFVLRNAYRMFAHTFRGSTWRSMLGLEDPRAAFLRFTALRARERQYLDWPDPLANETAVPNGSAPAVSAAGRLLPLVRT
jgi:anaerobic magnesium-protoporphyrin IX monomethyl ester cyclase